MKQHGGKRLGAGRKYSPFHRAYLAARYGGMRIRGTPAQAALETLHAEEHPGGEGDLETTRRLIAKGGHDEIFLAELDAKRHRREPLTAFEQQFLRQRRRWERRMRRRS